MAKGVLFLICFSQKVLYHAHLLGTEVAAVFLITQAYQGIKQTLGAPYFLSEASHGRYITKVGIVPHSGTAEGGSSFSNVVFHILV